MNMKVVLNSVILIVVAILFTNCYVIPCLYCNFIHEVHAHLIINFATWIKIILLGSFDQFRHILTKTILSNQASISQLKFMFKRFVRVKGNYIVLFAPIKYHSRLESFRTVLKSKVLVLFCEKFWWQPQGIPTPIRRRTIPAGHHNAYRWMLRSYSGRAKRHTQNFLYYCRNHGVAHCGL